MAADIGFKHFLPQKMRQKTSEANNKDFFLSKVAGLVALRRMPNLELRLCAPFEAADRK